MTFTVERLIKYLETFKKDSKVCLITKTKKVEVFPGTFEGGNIKELEINDINEKSDKVFIVIK